MRRKDKLPELLCPAGDFQALVAAVSAGADAVYIGGKSFSARAFAKNFDIEEIKRSVLYCHLHSVKLYVTVNTLVMDKELTGLAEYVAELSDAGVDAVITADLGVVRVISEVAPGLPVHASTQMSVHNLRGANAAAQLGATRVVLAREVSLKDINTVTDGCSIETEVFLHGALCVSHSGQCLFSSLVGGRSGNRGECAQPCRLPYGKGYPLSLSDLSLAKHIPELIASGVASLKIEGRMKSPDYVYGVTKIYRRLLDEGRAATRTEVSELERIFSRGGFTDGYFTAKTEEMTGVRSQDDKKNTRDLGRSEYTPERVGIKGRVKLSLGVPSELTLTLGDRSVTVFGDVPQEAISAPLTEESVKARVAKMGNTYFSLDPGDVEAEVDGGINLPPSAINALKRECAEALERLFITDRAPVGQPVCSCLGASTVKKRHSFRSALFLNGETARRVYSKGGFDYFDLAFLPLTDLGGDLPRDKVGVYMPPVVMESEREEVEELMRSARDKGFSYALAGNIGQVAMARDMGFTVVGDFRLNVTNSVARRVIESLGVERLVLSPEITLPMARDIGGSEICYGRVPLMLLERCYMKENFGCGRCDSCGLTDRTGATFPLMREFKHRNLLLNSAVTYMGDKQDELDQYKITERHFIFSTESCEEVLRVIAAFSKRAPLPLSLSVRRIGKR